MRMLLPSPNVRSEVRVKKPTAASTPPTVVATQTPRKNSHVWKLSTGTNQSRPRISDRLIRAGS